MQAGRLRKALARVYWLNGQPYTLGAFLISHPLVRRSHYIRHYATKRIDLEYKRLRTPAHEYTVWRLTPDGERGTSVPKIVYDALEHLPTQETEQPHEKTPVRSRGKLVHLNPF